MQRFQTSTATKLFRAVDAIALAKKVLPTNRKIRILSFGCSIGDEIATLRTFFPSAELFGCDIDITALSTAQATVGHLADIFLSSEDEIKKRGPYDLICALSSLCIHPLPKLEVFHQKFPFSRFDEIVSFLDTCLDMDGMFVIKNSSYPFVLSSVSNHYVPIRSDNIYQNGFVPVFNRNGKFALSVIDVPPSSAFKVEDVSDLNDWDFIDCVYQKRESKSPNQSPRVINSPLETPKVELNLIASWTRSNLDTWNKGIVNNLIEIKQVFSVFQAKEYPEQVFVECETFRSSIYGGQIIKMGRRGWWMDISSINGHICM